MQHKVSKHIERQGRYQESLDLQVLLYRDFGLGVICGETVRMLLCKYLEIDGCVEEPV